MLITGFDIDDGLASYLVGVVRLLVPKEEGRGMGGMHSSRNTQTLSIKVHLFENISRWWGSKESKV